MKKLIVILASLVLMLGLVGAVNALSCGNTITTDTTLTSDLIGCSGNGLTIGANDVTLDCDGHKLTGDGTGTGIYANGKSNVNIKNCVVEYFHSGIYLRSCNGGLVESNDVNAVTYRHIRLRESSNFEVRYNNIDGTGAIPDQSIQSGLCVSKATATNNYIHHNNFKNSGTKNARDSGTDNAWDSNYYGGEAIDWDCDGVTVYAPGIGGADLNAYVVENGWLGLPTYVDNDGDGYGTNCQLGEDCDDNDPDKTPVGVGIMFDDMESDLNWEYICRPWWTEEECDNVTIALADCPEDSSQCMEFAIAEVDTTGFDWSQYIDDFYMKDGMDWSSYHTMTFWVYPLNDARPVTKLYGRFDNDPECRNDLTYPTTLFSDDCRENQKSFTLVSNAWNKVTWDLSESTYAGGNYTPGDPRPTTKDDIKSLRFVIDRNPKDFDDDQALNFYIDDIKLITDEICDGKDNDCDGEVDEGFDDADNDGVANCVDKCPDSRPGEPVDKYGCDAFQFCEKFYCSINCFYADFMGDEPGEEYPRDCGVFLVNKGDFLYPKCVPLVCDPKK